MQQMEHLAALVLLAWAASRGHIHSPGQLKLNADCTATTTTVDSFGLTGSFKLVILESGKDFLIQNFTPGGATQGRAERIKGDK